MAKKILKIFAIVLAVSVVGVGILVGVMFLQGKFDEPYQEPTGLYFDIPDNVLNVTYDCTKNDLYDENGEPYNVYSFVLNARPANVTELNCMMTVVSGGQLIEFCGQDGKPLENEGVVSTIQIGKRIYFKIKNNFDNTSDKYNEAKGEVNLSFISSFISKTNSSLSHFISSKPFSFSNLRLSFFTKCFIPFSNLSWEITIILFLSFNSSLIYGNSAANKCHSLT